MTLYVYCITEGESDSACKIGVSADPLKRLGNLQAGNPRELSIDWLLPVPERSWAFAVENYVLGMFRPNVYSSRPRADLRSEWVEVPPAQALQAAAAYLDAHLLDAGEPPRRIDECLITLPGCVLRTGGR